MLKRPSLSISCVETRNPGPAMRAIESTVSCITVDCLYWFSNLPYPGHLPGVEIINVQLREFSEFLNDINFIYLRLVPRVVVTDFNLIVQADGFAVNPSAWDDIFWEYDYIGAPWTWMWGGGPYWNGPIVGNGGFSLRSRKLYRALLETDIKWKLDEWGSDPRAKLREYIIPDKKEIPEDLIISLWYREHFESKFGVKYCPPDLANKFSVETLGPFTSYWLGRSFGFHGPAAAPHYGMP